MLLTEVLETLKTSRFYSDLLALNKKAKKTPHRSKRDT